ncbi:MAG: hypothetical protein UU24_C0009G0008 [Candidatus Nomurabacteria bacterium GW2011_GWA2_40_9]|uniref:Uncharacterized protein n=1 Tax=Candidatus Nomurabacteria bacterium GW2011_GWA2_40_9 TaxID=1618734 RepID=A0A0G0TQZ1_9BACT|nr:MAG: hypothetical protein UU24_C0009G0008 [Candidatus Nomurabacteria bacterium GW2011_GWA2_40_9]
MIQLCAILALQKSVLRTVTGWWRGWVTSLGNKIGNTP